MAEITFIGTGDAFGSGGRRNSAILLRDGGRTLLMDCGPTTLIGLRDLGIDPLEIDAVAISHFHGDHAGGLPFLMLDYTYEDERHAPLTVLGPPGIRERIEHMNRALCFQAEAARPFPVTFREYTADVPMEIDGFRLTPQPAYHQEHTRPHMLRVDTDRRSVCFSGDTGWHEPLPEKVGDVDLFISECVFFEKGYEYHLSHEELDRARSRFRCAAMILAHLGSEMLANEARVHFDTAHDGLRLKV